MLIRIYWFLPPGLLRNRSTAAAARDSCMWSCIFRRCVMRNTWRLAVVIFAALLGAIGFGVARSAPHGARSTPKPPSPVGKLVVHEWGTFTNFAGADGIQ